MAVSRQIVALTLPLTCCGCTGWQSALDPRGPEAAHLSLLIWSFFAICVVVWIAVMSVLVAALRRQRRRRSSRTPHSVDAKTERHMGRSVAAAMAATTLIVMGLTVMSFMATRRLSPPVSATLDIRVRGYQWWWEVTYLDSRADQVFTTANEIHIPVGRPIHLELAAGDVIHSFWVPNLSGKQDMIPGRDNSLVFTARRPGTYRGQCAEFCGLQHAHMAFLIVVEPPQAFARWRQAQLAAASEPRDPQQLAGQKVFTSKPCAACHTIQGTSAAATIGPDLTHVASRRYIAAGLLQNTRGSLAAWIADPQTLKPGSNMPAVPLSAGELQAVSAYLAALQ